MKTDRSMVKMVLLSIITCGIYGIYAMTMITNDVNALAPEKKKTMHYCMMAFVFSWLTCGIYPLIWNHKMSNKVGEILKDRGIAYSFSASDFWLWEVLGSCIVVGPFVYLNKLCKAMNLLCEDQNKRSTSANLGM